MPSRVNQCLSSSTIPEQSSSAMIVLPSRRSNTTGSETNAIPVIPTTPMSFVSSTDQRVKRQQMHFSQLMSTLRQGHLQVRAPLRRSLFVHLGTTFSLTSQRRHGYPVNYHHFHSRCLNSRECRRCHKCRKCPNSRECQTYAPFPRCPIHMN